MKAWLVAVAVVASGAVGQTNDEAPRYARPSADVVLRSGPGQDFPGVREVDSGLVLRVGTERGVFVEVFVPDGFPVFVHRDFATVDEASATVAIAGDRVNARLLPTTVGNAPVGQVSAGDGPLTLLGVEDAWVRVLAPESMPLHAPRGALTLLAPGVGEELYSDLVDRRDARRTWRVNAWLANDPDARRDVERANEVAVLVRTDLAGATDEDLAATRARLAEIAEATAREDVRVEAEAFGAEIDAVLERRRETAASLEEIRRRERAELDRLAREARLLGLGLMFAGRGESATRRGLVVRRPVEEGLDLFSLDCDDGSQVKLTAPVNLVSLKGIAGKRVELAGREVTLSSVQGPVLVIDEVLWQEN